MFLFRLQAISFAVIKLEGFIKKHKNCQDWKKEVFEKR